MARKIKDTEDLPKAKITNESLKRAIKVFNYTGGHKWKFFLGLFFLIGTGATALVFPQFMGDLVDCAKNKDFEKANNIALFLFFILVFQSLFSFFRIFLFVSYTEHTLANLRTALYTHLIQLPMSFFTQKRVGELNSRISSDITQIQSIPTRNNYGAKT